MECSICFCEYDANDHKPLVLACGHTFCYGCTDELLVGRGSLQCPACDKAIEIANIQSLPVNFALFSLDLKQPETPPQAKTLTCSIHSKKAKFQCVSCNCLFCTNCFDAHKTHEIDSLGSYVLRKIDAALISVLAQKADIENKLGEIGSFSEVLEGMWKQAFRMLQDRYVVVGDSGANEFGKVVEELELVRSSNASALANYSGGFKERLNLLNDFLNSLRQAKQSSNHQILIESIQDIERRLKDTFDGVEPVVVNKIEFTPDKSDISLGKLTLSEEKYPLEPAPVEEAKLVPKIAPKEPRAKGRAPKTICWWQVNKHNKWVPFDPSDNTRIEKVYRSKQVSFDLRRARINFESMTILNTINGEIRKIFRELA